MLTENELAEMWNRHETDAAFHVGDHHPKSYVGGLLRDRGRLLAHIRQLAAPPTKAPEPITVSNVRSWFIENGFGDVLAPPLQVVLDCPIYGAHGARACSECENCDCKRQQQSPAQSPPPAPVIRSFHAILQDAWDGLFRREDHKAPPPPAAWSPATKAVVFRAMRMAMDHQQDANMRHTPPVATQERAA